METQPIPNGADEALPPPQSATLPPAATTAAAPRPTAEDAPPPSGRGPERSETVGKLALALAKAQGAMSAAAKDKENPYFRSRYADLASVWDACRLPLAENALAVVQTIETLKTWVIVNTLLAHESGEWISSRLAVPVTPGKDKDTGQTRITAQSFGSAITYARRYALSAMVGVAPDDDDDGNEASGPPPSRNGNGNRPPQGQRAPPPAQSARQAQAPAQQPGGDDGDVEAQQLSIWGGKIEATGSARELLEVMKQVRAAIRPGALLTELERIGDEQRGKLGRSGR